MQHDHLVDNDNINLFSSHPQQNYTYDEKSSSWIDTIVDFSSRILADDEYYDKKKSGIDIDYTILNMGIMTLGLIMIVEFFREQIDHAAKGRPFFTTVLNNLYHELSTLGIVEFIVYLLKKYWDNFPEDYKKTFGEVHFMLFFAACFNALQSVCLAILASRNSDQMWVRTEQLDIHNYKLIRLQYKEVTEKLEAMEGGSEDDDCDAQETWWGQLISKKLWRGLKQRIRYPALKRRHEALLVQIRYHELRYHFLKANNLPKKFVVSDYLKRSEVHVFKKLSHISHFAWIMLMAVSNLVYFFMGIVAYVTEDTLVVGTSLAVIYFAGLVLFVLFSVVLLEKLKWIFSEIMHKGWIDVPISGRPNDINENLYDSFHSEYSAESHTFRSRWGWFGQNKEVTQIDLFWGGNPSYVIGAVQFMQFGFAIAASFLLIFWHDVLDTDYARLNAHWFAVGLVLCYVVFNWIVAKILTRYTLCTSLGELVNKRILHETLATFKLDEAVKARNTIMKEEKDSEDAKNKAKKNYELSEAPGIESKQFSQQTPLTTATVEDKNSPKTIEEKSEGSFTGSDTLVKLTDFVTMEDEELVKYETSGRKKARQERHKRMKTVSDGVSMMRMRNLSDGVVSMRRMGSIRKMSDAAMTTLGLSDTGSTMIKKTSEIKPETEKPPSRPRGRKKSVSDGAISKSTSMNEFFAPVKSSELSDQKEVEGDSKLIHGCGSGEALGALLEDIPSRGVFHSKLDIPLGQKPMNGGSEVSIKTDNVAIDVEQPIEILTSKSAVQFDDHLINTNAENTPDDNTINVAGSNAVNSNMYNVPDLPVTEYQKDYISLSRKSEKIRLFFQTYNFRMIDGIFGTMSCFFLVGIRVEDLLIATGTIDDTGNTLHFSPEAVLWTETSWLCVFIAESIFLFFLYLSEKTESKSWAMIVSALIDFVLSTSCLCILMLAESVRCCSSEPFGSREKGGLGNIEPFTSLIGLRFLRFFLGRKIAGIGCQVTKNGDRRKDHQHKQTAQDQLHNSVDANGIHNTSKCGTAVELWEFAISSYTSIVAKYGFFSGEVLQAMLGINIIGNDRSYQDQHGTSHSISNGVETDVGAIVSQRRIFPNLKTPEKADDLLDRQDSNSLNLDYYLDRCHANLRTSVQAIIIAGKIGKPVRPQTTTFTHVHGRSNRSKFELDKMELANEKYQDQMVTNMDDDGSPIIAPNSKLIRSMRRCEWKLPPILVEWRVVDVVLTNHELVLLSAHDIDNTDMKEISKDGDISNKRELVREALIATKGGKGLRLRDVVAGRKIVGHLELSEVDMVKVARILPVGVDNLSSSNHGKASDHHVTSSNDVPEHELQVEYWSVVISEEGGKPFYPRNLRWEQVEEDELKIHTSQGTNYLRFFSDLEDWDALGNCSLHTGDVDRINKNDAVLWCQTIGRLCGTEQLIRQKLPHFGDKEETEELKDFIEIIDRESGLRSRLSGSVVKRKITFRNNLEAPPLTSSLQQIEEGQKENEGNE